MLSRRSETAALGALVLGLLSIRLLYFDHYAVPDSDFFQFQYKAQAFLGLSAPESFARLPLYSIAMAAVSLLLPLERPILAAAEVINLLAFGAACVLLYQLVKPAAGKWACLLVLWFGSDPMSLHLTIQPRSEMLAVALVLAALVTSRRHSGRAYGIGSLAAITRYETALLIPAFFLRDVAAGGRWKKAFVWAAVASFPLVLWLTANWIDTGNINPYAHHFQPGREAVGLDFVRLLLVQFFGVTGPWLTDAVSLKVLGPVVAATCTLGFLRLHAVDARTARPIGILFAAILLLKVRYHSLDPEQTFVLTWMMQTTFVIGLAYVAEWAWSRRRGRKPAPSLSVGRRRLALAIAPGAVLLVMLALRFGPDPKAILLFAITASMGLLVVAWIGSGKARSVPTYLIVVILSLGSVGAARANAPAALAMLERSRLIKAEIALAGEWYARHGDRKKSMAVTEPWIAAFAAPSDSANFFFTGRLESPTLAELPAELRRREIGYLVWDSHRRGLDPASYWYAYYRYDLLEPFSDGRGAAGLCLAETVRREHRYAHIYTVCSDERELSDVAPMSPDVNQKPQ